MKTLQEQFEEKRDKYIVLLAKESEYRFVYHHQNRKKNFENATIYREKRKAIIAELELLYLEIMEIYEAEPISAINIELKKEILIFKAKMGQNLVTFSINEAIKKQVEVLFLAQKIAFQNGNSDENDKISDEIIKLISISKKPLDYFL